jgi:hypothetical protein
MKDEDDLTGGSGNGERDDELGDIYGTLLKDPGCG